MKPVDFVYWLQGYFELSEDKTLNEKQVTAIKNHLALVFEHVIDPSYTSHLLPADAAKVQDKLQQIHDSGPFPNSQPTTTVARPPSTLDFRDRVYKC